DRPARRVDEVGGWFHQRQAFSVHEVTGLWRERAADIHDVGAAEHLLEADQLHVELGRNLAVRIGIMGYELHPERLQQAEQLGADIADPDRAECTPDEADAHMLAPPD